jgi:hypothetical protein
MAFWHERERFVFDSLDTLWAIAIVLHSFCCWSIFQHLFNHGHICSNDIVINDALRVLFVVLVGRSKLQLFRHNFRFNGLAACLAAVITLRLGLLCIQYIKGVLESKRCCRHAFGAIAVIGLRRGARTAGTSTPHLRLQSEGPPVTAPKLLSSILCYSSGVHAIISRHCERA